MEMLKQIFFFILAIVFFILAIIVFVSIFKKGGADKYIQKRLIVCGLSLISVASLIIGIRTMLLRHVATDPSAAQTLKNIDESLVESGLVDEGALETVPPELLPETPIPTEAPIDTPTEAPISTEVPTGDEEISALEFYELTEENAGGSFKINKKAKAFFKKHDQFFPLRDNDKDIEKAEEILDFMDYEMTYRSLEIDIDSCGDKLMYLNNLSVLMVEEQKITEKCTMTSVAAVDSEMNYYIINYKAKEKIAEGDIIKTIALPLAIINMDDGEGGVVDMKLLAGSCSEIM